MTKSIILGLVGNQLLSMIQQEDDEDVGATTLLKLKFAQLRSSPSLVIVIVSFALFTDMALYNVIIPILPAIIERAKGDESDIGRLFAVYSAGYLFSSPLFGIWSDRLKDRKIPMILGQLGLAVSTLLFILARSIPMLMAARLFQGIIISFA